MLELSWTDLATGEKRAAVVVQIDDDLYVRRSDAVDHYVLQDDRDGRCIVFHSNVERSTRMYPIGEVIEIVPAHWSAS